MQLAARTGAWERSGKPLPYDAEVEYLEQPVGIEYQKYGIDTGTYINFQTSEIEFKYHFIIHGNIYFSTTDGSVQNFSAFQIARMNALAANKRSDAIKNRVYRHYLSNSLCEIYDETAHEIVVSATGDAGVGVSTGTFWLFSTPIRTGYTNVPKIRLYYCTIKDSGKLVRDLIPVRFTNENGVSEGAMYNRLGVGGMNPDGSLRNDGLFRNQGTGAFIIGPDKVSADGGGYNRLCVRRSHRRSLRPSARFCALSSRHSQEWEVAA